MRKTVFLAAILCLTSCFAGCGADEGRPDDSTTESSYTVNTKIEDVTSDPVYGEYGRLIFPVDSSYYSGDTLGELHLTWYNNIDPDKTVEIVNYMKAHAE